jgi:hypothetical protein
MNDLLWTLLTGIGATAVMDAWGIARKPLVGMPPPDYRMLGRWVGHMARGRFRHDSIAAARAVRGEQPIGWAAHYGIGIAFAAVLVALCGSRWIEHPTIGPALALGIGGVAAPFLVMQPAMGAGIAASRTARPWAARIQSVVTHAFFGLGLYAAGWAAHFLLRP